MPQNEISDQGLESVDRFFDDFRNAHHVPGIAYGVVLNGDLIHSGGTGTIRIPNDQRPDAATVSRICSMTKSFVAVAMLILRDKGTVQLDDLVADHVPELARLRLPTSDSPPLSVRHLLTMSGGLPEDDAWGDRHIDRSRSWVDDLFEGGFTFASAPGTAFEYSNLGWVALGRVISNVADMSVQEFVRRRILSPLGLNATGWEVPTETNVHTGHRWRDDSFEEVGAPLPDGDFSPMAGLWSSVEDLARWVGFFTDAFPARDGDDNAILRRASRREMQQAHRLWPLESKKESDRLLGRGYGYGLVAEHDHKLGYMVGHAGGLPGFGSFMRWLPERGLGVIALGNSTYAPMDKATLGVLDALDRSDAISPAVIKASPDLQRAHEQLLTLFNEWSDELAKDAFAMNVSLDEDLSRRRQYMATLRSKYGPFESRSFVPASATRASFSLRGSKGTVKGSFSLSPEPLPKIQTYEVTPAE